MIDLMGIVELSFLSRVALSVLFVVGFGAATALGYKPIKAAILRQEQTFDEVLRGKLLIDIKPRTVTICSAILAMLLTLIFMLLIPTKELRMEVQGKPVP